MDAWKNLAHSTMESYALWSEIAKGETPDPYVSDGVMMNYVRQKIVANKNELRAHYELLDLPLPLVCTLPDPPQMADDYMVQTGLLKSAARMVINALRKSESYRQFVELAGALPVRKRSVRPITDTIRLLAEIEQAERANDTLELRKRLGVNIKSDADAARYVENKVKKAQAAVAQAV